MMPENTAAAKSYGDSPPETIPALRSEATHSDHLFAASFWNDPRQWSRRRPLQNGTVLD